MTTKHTPGPWIVELGNQISTHEFQPVGVAHVMRQGGCEEANARLIAAAPDMLEALQAIVEADGQPDEVLQIAMIRARAVLSKINQE